MAGEDMVVMSLEEVRRLKVVQLVIEKHTTEKIASSMLILSERQVRRLVKAALRARKRPMPSFGEDDGKSKRQFLNAGLRINTPSGPRKISLIRMVP